ncbi:MAG TPA: iron-containing alcohol dehydrogenase [Acidobacteriota bacterium]|jgi:alcohol dehydrogenase class IV
MISYFSFPTQIIFGPGSIELLAQKVRLLEMKHPMVVTDPGILRAGLLARVEEQLKKANLEFSLFSDVAANPTEDNVTRGTEQYRTSRCDGIVAVGGGSPLDAGKAIRLKVTHDLPLEEYDDLRNGAGRIRPELPHMIAIATTSGTGSEVSRSTVITIKQTNRKTVIFSPQLIPSLAIADPELTQGMPARVTAGTGMDALTHNLEAYLSAGYHPMCDAIALQGIKLVAENLPGAVRHGDDIEYRSNMLMASMMGAVAFQKGLGATHSLAHPLSSEAGMHHGTANALMLPYVMEFNLEVAAVRLRDVAMAMGCDVSGLRQEEAAREAIRAVEELVEEVGIPRRLRDLPIAEQSLPALANKAIQDGCHLLNPRPCSEQDMLELYRRAF